jgi:hypothetical protein
MRAHMLRRDQINFESFSTDADLAPGASTV